MSLPIIIIFERHWDTIPKKIIKDILPDLSERDYGTLCFEAPQNLSSAEIIERHSKSLESDSDLNQKAQKYLNKVGIISKLSEMSFIKLANLTRLYVSSQHYLTVAEKIKNLPASQLLKEVFQEASRLSISLKGIDINHEELDKIITSDFSERNLQLKLVDDDRTDTIFQNLLKFQTEQERGIIFICGALHAKKLIDLFKNRGLQDRVLYYFPHSSSRYDDSTDDIKTAMNNILENHTYLLSKNDIKPFKERIIKEIDEKTKYQKEIHDYNSHTQFLSDRFKTKFRAFLRPGYHLDALVNVAEASNIDYIQKSVSATGVETRRVSLDGQEYLTIPNVNTKAIAERIRKV